MDNNEFNRRIRYALRLDDAETVRLTQMGGQGISMEQAAGFRCKDDEPSHLACPDTALLALLDGLILDRRGPPPARTAGPDSGRSGHGSSGKGTNHGPSHGTSGKEAPGKADQVPEINNNLVLKQLRIALSLRSDDIYKLMVAGGGKVGKTEVGAFFRSPDARNYRRCGDQAVRWFLSGLAAQRGE